MVTRKVILVSFGSAGDLLPLLAVGKQLKSRGCQASMIAGPELAPLVERSGLEFVPFCSALEHRQSIGEAAMLASKYSARFIQKHVVAWNATVLAYLSRQDPAKTICIANERPLIWADLCANMHWDLPCVRLASDPPAAADARLGDTSRPRHRLQISWQADWRRAAGRLGIGAGWNHTQRLVRATRHRVARFALWPEWFAPCRDIGNLKKFGFIGEELETPSLPKPANQPGGPALVFIVGSLGTNREWARHFSAVAAEVCRQLGMSGLILGGQKQDEIDFNPNVTWERFLPLRSALRSAVAVVHHAGIGTIAASLKAGLPQLCIPRVFGQATHSRQAVRLGFARELDPARVDVANVCQELKTLLASPSYRKAAGQLGSRIDGASSVGALAQAILDQVIIAPHRAGSINQKAA